jgi:hypothetical protein
VDLKDQVRASQRGPVNGRELNLPALDPAVIEATWRSEAKQRLLDRNTPIQIQLPSGKIVMAVRASLRWLYKHERIPDHILTAVESHIALIEESDPKKIESEYQKKLAEDEAAAFGEWLAILRALWCACVVVPSFTEDRNREDAQEPPFWVGDTVDFFDLMYLYTWAQGVDQTVVEFFQQQSSLMGSLADSDSIPLSATGVLRADRFGNVVPGDDGGSSDVAVGQLHPEQDGRQGRKARRSKQEAADDAGASVQRGGHLRDDSRAAPAPRGSRSKREPGTRSTKRSTQPVGDRGRRG